MGRIAGRIPPWIRFVIPGGPGYARVKASIIKHGLNTVCTEAHCPNIGECFGAGTATFLILGQICTRNCRYCAVTRGDPQPPDPSEPSRIADAVAELNLRHAVITSVTRDDLEDGGASIFAETVGLVREKNPVCGIEVLVPDFSRSMERSVEMVAERQPDVINHNIEVSKSHYAMLRPMGSYDLSLRLLRFASRCGASVKSGFMVGFGESMDDIDATLHDLREAGCAHVTVGQYLQSRKENHTVEKFYSPEEFDAIADMAKVMGFGKVQCGPLVRSSYHAGL